MSRASKPVFRFHLDLKSGVPVYRQIIDQVAGGMASGSLAAGDQLPTVRQVAVDLAINPNTVMRAYRELEIGGLLETHQGTGTFISARKSSGPTPSGSANWRRWFRDCLARAGAAGFTVEECIGADAGLAPMSRTRRR